VPFVLDTSATARSTPTRQMERAGDAIAAAGGAEGTMGKAGAAAAGTHMFDPKADTRINGFPTA